jgi:hypothetical protein
MTRAEPPRQCVDPSAEGDLVWRVLSDAANVADWFPAMAESTGDAEGRRVTLLDGSKLEEAVVTSDAYPRRFQYRVVGGDLAIEHHLGTVDVIDLGEGSCLVVYGTEIEPEAAAAAFDGATGTGRPREPGLGRSGPIATLSVSR